MCAKLCALSLSASSFWRSFLSPRAPFPGLPRVSDREEQCHQALKVYGQGSGGGMRMGQRGPTSPLSVLRARLCTCDQRSQRSIRKRAPQKASPFLPHPYRCTGEDVKLVSTCRCIGGRPPQKGLGGNNAAPRAFDAPRRRRPPPAHVDGSSNVLKRRGQVFPKDALTNRRRCRPRRAATPFCSQHMQNLTWQEATRMTTGALSDHTTPPPHTNSTACAGRPQAPPPKQLPHTPIGAYIESINSQNLFRCLDQPFRPSAAAACPGQTMSEPNCEKSETANFAAEG